MCMYIYVTHPYPYAVEQYGLNGWIRGFAPSTLLHPLLYDISQHMHMCARCVCFVSVGEYVCVFVCEHNTEVWHLEAGYYVDDFRAWGVGVRDGKEDTLLAEGGRWISGDAVCCSPEASNSSMLWQVVGCLRIGCYINDMVYVAILRVLGVSNMYTICYMSCPDLGLEFSVDMWVEQCMCVDFL